MNEITIFRSEDPASFAKVMALLRSADIPFHALDKREGGAKSPRTVHMITVHQKQTEHARQVISQIPSEIILSSDNSSPTRNDRVIAWIQISTLVIIVVVSLIKAFLD